MASDLPDETDIVVIGGGAIGSSVAYHLCRMNAGDVTLIERRKLTCGTTWHSAGQVRQLRSSRNLTDIIRYSTELYARLEAETGQSTGWTPSGSLSIATNQDRMTHIRRQAGLARAQNVDVHEVGPDDISKLWPLLNVSDVIGGIHCPGDGRVNPSDVSAALVRGGRAKGLNVVEDCPVTGFELRDGEVRGVETGKGTIRCRAVALCAGLWSRPVAALAGLDVPVFACEHFYLLTKPIDGLEGPLPTLGNHDSHLYIRDEVGGLLLGCFEPGARPVHPDDLPKDFEFDLLDEDWDHFEPMMLNGMHRVPALETAEARMLLNGPESFTPDGQPIVGESADVRGFYMACGMNSAGIASAGGVGRALAEWIVAGRSGKDLLQVDACRFHPVENLLPGLAARAAETLTLHYEIVYPGLEHETARDLRRTPLYDRLDAAGARFGQRFGCERALFFDPDGTVGDTLTFGRPPWFDMVAGECEAARRRVGLVDDSLFGKLRVEGRDAAALLDRVCMSDMTRAPGRIAYTAMLNERGGIESDLTVFRESETAYVLYTNATAVRRDRARLSRGIGPGEDVAVTDISDDLAVIGVMGPCAGELLTTLSGDEFSAAAFPYFSHRPATVAGVSVRAARLSYAGELGWELALEPSRAAALYDALREAGAPLGVAPVGAYAMNVLRLEKGYLSFGHDIGPDETPLEAGLGGLVKLASRRPFMGRDALLAQSDEGVRHRLVTLVFDDTDVFPIADEPILWRDAIAGQVSSAGYGHTVGRPVALGYLALAGGEREADLEGRNVVVDIAGRHCVARVSLRGAFDPDGLRLRGIYDPPEGAA